MAHELTLANTCGYNFCTVRKHVCVSVSHKIEKKNHHGSIQLLQKQFCRTILNTYIHVAV